MRYTVVFCCSLFLSGCATIFTGYESEVAIRNLPDSVQVFTEEGIELPSSYSRNVRRANRISPSEVDYTTVVDSTYRSIHLRSNRDYVLVFKSPHSVYRYAAYAKLSGWWFALDLVCGGIPCFIDAITGNWNYYDAIWFTNLHHYH